MIVLKKTIVIGMKYYGKLIVKTERLHQVSTMLILLDVVNLYSEFSLYGTKINHISVTLEKALMVRLNSVNFKCKESKGN